MKVLSRRSKKRALSNVIGYVLLIAITISLSVMVYGWLRFYVMADEVEECSSGVNVIIKDYNCARTVPGKGVGYLNITLKNKGLFNVDGYTLRVHYREDATFGLYTFNETGSSIVPGGEVSHSYSFDDYDFEKVLTDLSLVEVQPFILDGDKISCKSHSLQMVSCE